MKYKKIRIHGQFLARLIEDGTIHHFKCIQGLPHGTEFCYSIPDTLMGIWIVISHPSFPTVADGEMIPEFEGPISWENLLYRR